MSAPENQTTIYVDECWDSDKDESLYHSLALSENQITLVTTREQLSNFYSSIKVCLNFLGK